MTVGKTLLCGLDNFPFTQEVLPCSHLAGVFIKAEIIAPARNGLNVRNRDLPASGMFQRVSP